MKPSRNSASASAGKAARRSAVPDISNGAGRHWQSIGPDGFRPVTRFRYSGVKIRSALLAAVAMTATVSGLAWMMLSAAYHPHAIAYTALSGLAFFAFISAAMLFAYWRKSDVIAILPTGLFDRRWQREPVSWDAIREIVLRRVEDEFELDVYLWPGPGNRGRPNVPDHIITLAPLDAPAAVVVDALRPHVELRIDNNSGLASTRN